MTLWSCERCLGCVQCVPIVPLWLPLIPVDLVLFTPFSSDFEVIMFFPQARAPERRKASRASQNQVTTGTALTRPMYHVSCMYHVVDYQQHW